MDEAWSFDSSYGETALTVFGFGQDLAGIWGGPDFAVRREILRMREFWPRPE